MLTIRAIGYGAVRGQGLADYQILPWMCGMRNAMELMLTNGQMTGIEAEAKHFATKAVPQAELEADYKAELRARYGVEFTSLFTITNQPIARFAEDLRAQGRAEEYLELLATAFNPATVPGLMCRTTLSVGWRGELYDCDFNQMLGMRLKGERAAGAELFLWDVTPGELTGRNILTGEHCLACTAGAGSSCGGALSAS